MPGRLVHGLAALPHHGEKHRQDQRDHQRQLPLDGEHDGKGAHNGHAGDEDVLRAVVSQLRDVEEVCGQAAHELTGAVAVVVVKAQLLHVAEQVPADIRLHQDAEGVAPVADDILEHRPQGKGHKHHRHHREKRAVSALGQQLVHAPAGDVGKRQIDQGDHQRAGEIHNEQLPMGPEVGEEDRQRRFLLKFTGGHSYAPCSLHTDTV